MKMKKLVAITLTAAMVLGSSIMVYADDTVTGTTTGITGTGSSTGHVETEVVNVVWPTVNADATTFNFVMDAERLLKTTGKYKGGDVTLPTTGDTGVYFATTTSGTYANTSTELEVTNKSSVDLDISATAKATGGTNVTLVDSAEKATGKSGVKLYLGIIVSDGTTDDEKAVTADGATAKATIAGYADNYEYTSVNDGTYTYQLKTSPDDSKWSKGKISLTGAVNESDDATGAVAPTAAVTWKYEKKSTSALSATTISKASGGSITVTGKTVSSIVMAKNDNTDVTAVSGTHYTLNGSTYTFASSVLSNKTKITFNFNDNTSEEVTVQ